MRRYIQLLVSILVLASFAASCNYDEMVDVVALGAEEKEMFIPARPGIDTISLVTNVPYEVQVVQGASWLKLGGTGRVPSARKEIPFVFDANYGYRRMAKVTLSAATRTDTVFVKQEGPLEDRVYLSEKTFDVPSEGGRYSTEVECVRYPDGLQVESTSRYVQAVYSKGRLDVSVAPSRSKDILSYTVTVYYIDGWGDRVCDQAVFTQKAKK